MNPYLFIVGCPRSGTTLLRRMIDAHPEIAIPSAEQHWIGRLVQRRNGVSQEGVVTHELFSNLLEDRRFATLRVTESELHAIATPGISRFAHVVTQVLDRFGDAEGKRLVGDKSPGHVRRIAELHQLWPEAKFVHVIRDGRDVALSVMSWSRADRIVGRFPTWTRDRLTTAALWWEWTVRLGREAGDTLGSGLYYELGYESLVAEPERELASLCVFLDVPYDEAMLRFHQGRSRTKAGLSAKKAWLPPTPGLRDWRTQMPAEEIDRFEAAAGDLLEELGYARSRSSFGPRTLEQAAVMRVLFTQGLHARGCALPGGAR